MKVTKLEISLPPPEGQTIHLSFRPVADQAWQISSDGGSTWIDLSARPVSAGNVEVRKSDSPVFHGDANVAATLPDSSRWLAGLAQIKAPEIIISDTEDHELSRHLLPIDEGARVIIGRSARKADINIPDRYVSRMHLLISKRSNRYYVADHQSSHGTLVNGVPIDPDRPLVHNDLIELGHSKIRFVDVIGLLKSQEDSSDRSVLFPSDMLASDRPELIDLPDSQASNDVIDRSSRLSRKLATTQDSLLEPWMLIALVGALTALLAAGLYLISL